MNPTSRLRTARRLAPGLAACLWAASALASEPAAQAAPAKPAAAAKAAKAAPAEPVAEAPAAPADPLEHLRQRLSEKLSAAKAGPSSGPYDVRVSARSGQPATPAHASARAAGHARPAKVGTEHGSEAAHWSYQGSAGPTAWGGLKPEFSLCNTGQRQSPIDIRAGLAVDLEPIRFDYQASKFGVVDNGHTVQVNLAPGNSIDIGGRRFELLQFHFHRPSEERIDGRQFEMSLHLVHRDDKGRLAVVGLLFDKGPAHPVVQKVWSNLPLERGEEAPARVPLDLRQLLPEDRRYYTYMGSLTTPPCSEGVQWIVMRQPVTLTGEQIEIFARMYPMNARPLQAAAGRRILQSD